jgi:hypothetical protein
MKTLLMGLIQLSFEMKLDRLMDLKDQHDPTKSQKATTSAPWLESQMNPILQRRVRRCHLFFRQLLVGACELTQLLRSNQRGCLKGVDSVAHPTGVGLDRVRAM